MLKFVVLLVVAFAAATQGGSPSHATSCKFVIKKSVFTPSLQTLLDEITVEQPLDFYMFVKKLADALKEQSDTLAFVAWRNLETEKKEVCFVDRIPTYIDVEW